METLIFLIRRLLEEDYNKILPDDLNFFLEIKNFSTIQLGVVFFFGINFGFH